MCSASTSTAAVNSRAGRSVIQLPSSALYQPAKILSSKGASSNCGSTDLSTAAASNSSNICCMVLTSLPAQYLHAQPNVMLVQSTGTASISPLWQIGQVQVLQIPKKELSS